MSTPAELLFILDQSKTLALLFSFDGVNVSPENAALIAQQLSENTAITQLRYEFKVRCVLSRVDTLF